MILTRLLLCAVMSEPPAVPQAALSTAEVTKQGSGRGSHVPTAAQLCFHQYPTGLAVHPLTRPLSLANPLPHVRPSSPGSLSGSRKGQGQDLAGVTGATGLSWCGVATTLKDKPRSGPVETPELNSALAVSNGAKQATI